MKRLMQLSVAVFGMTFLSVGCSPAPTTAPDGGSTNRPDAAGTDGSSNTYTYNGEGTMLLEGTCEDRAGHDCNGNAALFQLPNGQIELRLASNFNVVNIPGGVMYLSSRQTLGSAVNGSTDVNLGGLNSINGAQNYTVPQGQSTGRTYAWIWCLPFSVEVGRWVMTPPAQPQ
jgi:hypothetical protein